MEADTAMPALPDDMLAAILSRLPSRTLAASRCVCEAWRDLVDERQLLLPRLLPHSVRGIFANYIGHEKPHFFARPASSMTVGPRIDGEFSYIAPPDNHRGGRFKVEDHCNGLVLCRDDGRGDLYVCNPMDQRWVHLPLLDETGRRKSRAFLVFDPAVSLHYEVLMSPDVATLRGVHGHMEWPPSPWTWHVFSSRTKRWQERVFVREGEAAGTIADMLRVMETVSYVTVSPWRYAAYWQGALYVHCHGEYVSRLSLTDRKYQVIESPIDRTDNKVRSFLGRSKEGIYFAAIRQCRLRVWTLYEWHGQREWVLKYDRVLKPRDWSVALASYQQIHGEGPWIWDDVYDSAMEENAIDWSSDDDNIIPTCNRKKNTEHGGGEYPGYIVLGFNPYKEAIFLASNIVVVAYHLNTSKVQLLGILKPSTHEFGMYDSFVYTPCHSLRHRGL
ncbi:unnamed protein product [Urochloa humidicola]